MAQLTQHAQWALEHMLEFQPSLAKGLKAQGTLIDEAKARAERAGQIVTDMLARGRDYQEAWEHASQEIYPMPHGPDLETEEES